MNRDLEALIFAWEAVQEAMATGTTSETRDDEVKARLQVFESGIDDLLGRHPKFSRDLLRDFVIRKHLEWARKQDKKPPTIPPKA